MFITHYTGYRYIFIIIIILFCYYNIISEGIHAAHDRKSKKKTCTFCS